MPGSIEGSLCLFDFLFIELLIIFHYYFQSFIVSTVTMMMMISAVVVVMVFAASDFAQNFVDDVSYRGCFTFLHECRQGSRIHLALGRHFVGGNGQMLGMTQRTVIFATEPFLEARFDVKDMTTGQITYAIAWFKIGQTNHTLAVHISWLVHASLERCRHVAL